MSPTNYLYAICSCFVLFVSVRGGFIDFSDCGSEYELISVEIDGCDIIPCLMENKKSYKVAIHLKPRYKSTFLTQEVKVKQLDVDVKLSVTPDNPCVSLLCPVNANGRMKLVGTITLSNTLLPVKGELWWRMKTDTKKTAICMKTSVRIIR